MQLWESKITESNKLNKITRIKVYQELRGFFRCVQVNKSVETSIIQDHRSLLVAIFRQHTSKNASSYHPSSVAFTFFPRWINASIPCSWGKKKHFLIILQSTYTHERRKKKDKYIMESGKLNFPTKILSWC